MLIMVMPGGSRESSIACKTCSRTHGVRKDVVMMLMHCEAYGCNASLQINYRWMVTLALSKLFPALPDWKTDLAE